MSLILSNLNKQINQITSFLETTFQSTGIKNAVIAVSGGIDSALSLTLLAKTLPKNNIFPVLLPYGEQSIEDSLTICKWNNIPDSQITILNIKEMVDEICKKLMIKDDDHVRKGNVMARVRMIVIYDMAKKHNALVCGTENKSEKYLGYFTRFGDEASDIEPIQQLYKTQVRQIAEFLKLPSIFLEKSPSAGLWSAQTDELELGFSYADADKIMEQYIDQKIKPENITGVSKETVNKVIERIKSQEFKHEVPYHL